MTEFPSAGTIALSLATAYILAGWLIALANYFEREVLPDVLEFVIRHLIRPLHQCWFNYRHRHHQSPEVHRRCAVHEAGHAVVFLRLCPGRVRGVQADGYFDMDGDGGVTQLLPHAGLMVEQDYLDLIAGFYGGLVAERLVLGQHSLGCQNDLRQVAEFADRAHNLFAGGHNAPPIDFATLGRLGFVSDALEHQRMATVVQLLKQGHERALNILSEERATLDAIVEVLLQQGELSRQELLALNEKHALKKA